MYTRGGGIMNNNISIPEFIDSLDLEQLRMVKRMCSDKIEKITDQEKVLVHIFNTGVINEGFYSTEQEAFQAMKDYVNSKEHAVHDKLRIIKSYEYKDEAKRLIGE